MCGGFSIHRGSPIISEFESGLSRARNLGLAAQAFCVAVAVSSAICATGLIIFLNDSWPDALTGTEDYHALELLLLVNLALLVTSFIFVGMWIYRAHANLSLTAAVQSRFTPGEAVGWFALPIANLFMPFKAMKALWQSSHKISVNSGDTAPGLLWVWWITWIGSNAFGFSENFSGFDVAGHVATTISAICLTLIIGQINVAQPSMSLTNVFE